jgi:hypothetical protein
VRVRSLEVAAVTVNDLLDGLERVDLLHIDTEGNDAAILDAFPVEALRPAVVQFEHKHLSEADRQRCERRLRALGYRLRSSRHDTLAIRPDR